MKERTPVDWEAVEIDWRAGIKTKLDISREHKVSRAAIDKHFKKLGIGRDLTARITARTTELVTADAVTYDDVTRVTHDKDVIEANAQMQAAIIRSHRTDITKSRSVAARLLGEIESQTIDKELYSQLAVLLYSPDEKGMDKLNELYRKVIETPNRIKGMKDLTDTLKTLIMLERQAFNIADERGTGGDGDAKKTFAEAVANAIGFK